MTPRAYRFKVGDIACMIVSDGSMAYPDPLRMFFLGAPTAERDQLLRDAGIVAGVWREYVSPHCALLVDTGDQRVLVDTGGGGFVPSDGKLHDSLRVEGVPLDTIDLVVLTHAHPDHVGGNLEATQQPAFRNARYVVWRDEWNFWTGEPDLSSLALPDQTKAGIVTLAKQKLLPLVGQLELLDSQTTVAPGVQAIAAPGHTPGHLAVVVSSNGEHLLWCGDAILHPIQVSRPEWCGSFDLYPDQVVTTRRMLLSRAVDERVLVHGAHFQWPGLGHVTRYRDCIRWEPVPANT